MIRGIEIGVRSFSVPAFLLACGAWACLPSSVFAAPYFYDDFEGHAVGDMLIPSTPATVGRYVKYGSGGDTIVTNGPLGGNVGKFAFHPGAAGYAEIYQFTDGTNTAGDVNVVTETVTYDLDFYVVGNAATVSHSDIYLLAGWAETWKLQLYSDGTLKYGAGGPSISVGSFPTNAWVNLKLVADYQTHTFNATVGAARWSGSLGHNYTSRLYITSDPGGPGAGLYIDNVSIVPESSALSPRVAAAESPALTIEELRYASSVDATAPLFADVAFVRDGKAKPLVAVMHGFAGMRQDMGKDIRDLAARGLFSIAPDMRGRGKSGGRWDCAGLDVYDIVDAILAAAAKYPSEIDVANINLIGYSGGGGNCFSAMVRFPDLFHVIAPFFGITDYGMWYRQFPVLYGKRMKDAIGGSPEELPLQYAARNACLGAQNNRGTKLHVFWDEKEEQCPPAMDEKFLEAYRVAGCTNATAHTSREGDAIRWFHGYRTEYPMLKRADDILVKEILSPVPDLALPPKGSLTVCGYVVCRGFQVFVEDGRRGVVKIDYDLTGTEAKVTVKENPDHLRVQVSYKTPLSALGRR